MLRWRKKIWGRPVKLDAFGVSVIGILGLVLGESGEKAQTYFVQHINHYSLGIQAF